MPTNIYLSPFISTHQPPFALIPPFASYGAAYTPRILHPHSTSPLISGWAGPFLPYPSPYSGSPGIDARPNQVLPNGTRSRFAASPPPPPLPYGRTLPRAPLAIAQVLTHPSAVDSNLGTPSSRRHNLPVRTPLAPAPRQYAVRWAAGPASISTSAISRSSARSARSTTSCGSVIDGRRMDDGWNGSIGRVHNGFEPDITSAAGRLTPAGGGNAETRLPPSSWQGSVPGFRRLAPSVSSAHVSRQSSAGGGAMPTGHRFPSSPLPLASHL